MELKHILLIISLSAPLFAAIIGRRARNHPMWYYVVLAILMDWITTIMKVHFNQNIQWAGNIFLALEIFFFAVFFINFLKAKPYWPYWLGTLLLAIWFLYGSCAAGFGIFNRFGASVLCVTYSIVCLIGYRRILTLQNYHFIEQSGSFWIVSGIFLYASTSSIIFALPEILKDEAVFNSNVWSYFYILINIIRYILIGIGLRLYAKYGD
jgi:hypothetical protein